VSAPERIAEAVFAVIGAFFAVSLLAAGAYVVLRRAGAGWRIR
jgi:hypothetical protein